MQVTYYQIIKNQKYRTFRQKYFSLHPTFFMKLHSSYLNFVHFVTKNAIAAPLKTKKLLSEMQKLGLKLIKCFQLQVASPLTPLPGGLSLDPTG